MKALSNALAILTLATVAISYTVLSPVMSRTSTAVILAVKNGAEVALALPETISSNQERILNFAYEVAKADGYKKPQWLQGIILQETKAGEMKQWRVAGLQNKIGDRYFGVSQIKLAAAKDVMSKYPELWKYLDTRTDEELQARLVLDDEFNIRVASKYGLMMGINQDANRGITAYNQGEAGARQVDAATWGYTKAVSRHVETLKNVQLKNNNVQLRKN